MRPLVVATCLLLAALALLPAAAARPPIPPGCDPGACHVTITVPPGVQCPEAGHYDSYTVGIVTVRVLHCDSGVPP